jgi:hypothetical protein
MEKQISTGREWPDSMPYALFAASQRTIQIDVKETLNKPSWIARIG